MNLTENVDARTATSVGLSWTTGVNNGGSGIIDFTISYDNSTDTFVELKTNNLGTNFTAINLKNG